MIRAGILAATVGLVLASAAPAQSGGWRFRWQSGQVLVYKFEQSTTAAEVIEGKRTETTAQLAVTKRWQVLGVDAAGVATVQKTVTALRLRQTTPSGEVLLFDSADPDRSTPQLREELSKYVNQPLEVLRVDAWGRVIEVKECKIGSPSQFESDLPFVLALPAEAPQPGQGWERAYHLTLDPPKGTGEKYEAVQKYVCKGVTNGTATIGLTTIVKMPPESALDRVPLLQLQPEGDVVFDVPSGMLRSAKLKIEKEVTGHQGEGSSYRYQSTYSEEYVGNN
jgi:hypothetical protein